MGKSKAAKKSKAPASDKNSYWMKIVLSDTCEACKTPCTRGLAYLRRMRTPGSVGKGLPCPLTKKKI